MATLEEALDADVLLVVVDLADPDWCKAAQHRPSAAGFPGQHRVTTGGGQPDRPLPAGVSWT